MINTRKALTGSRVYGAGTTSPNQGQVSAAGAQGYLQREMRNRNQGNVGLYGGVSKRGADGQSDTRSGVAAQALQRQQRIRDPRGNNGGGGTPRPGQPDPKPQQPQFQQGNGQQNFQQGNPNPNTNDTPFGNGSDPEGEQGGQEEIPSLIVNDAGQLELPYSAAWSDNLLANLSQYNQDLMALNLGQQQAGLEYTAGLGQANREYEDVQRSTLAGAGAAGTVFSSQYGTSVGNNANAHNNTVNQLNVDKKFADDSSRAQSASIIEAFRRQMQQDAAAYAAELAENAGGLGLGGDGSNGGDGPGGDNPNVPTFQQGNGGPVKGNPLGPGYPDPKPNGGPKPKPTFQQGPGRPKPKPGMPKRNTQRAAKTLMKGKK